MSMAAGTSERNKAAALALKDPTLLRARCFVGGAWIEADDGRTFDVVNPATGDTLGAVPSLGAKETQRAIDAANASWPAWRTQTAKQRCAILRRWHDLIVANAEDLARLITAEQGKPLAEARGEISYGASFVEWFAEEAKRVYGDTIPQHRPDVRLLVTKQPVGVVGAITPWNFPLAMITRKCAPALAAGCPVVIKPAEATPLTALALAALGERAGLPAGVFNVITGQPAEIGQELTGNPLVRKLSFTGSTAVGTKLMAACAGTVKKISLELGGNAPFLVFDDADLDAAVAGAIASKFRNTGQTCVCSNRILVQDGVYDAFAQKLATAARKLRVGNGLESDCEQGPLISVAALAKVERHIADATRLSARILAGGKRHALGGTFFEPTVIADATPQMLLAHEETFGPVAPLFRFRSEEEAIALANDSESGLAAYVYSRDIGRAWRVAEALECGLVGVNEGLISTEVAPFGGMKESGIGREGSHYGIEEFVEVKYICLGGISP